MENKEKKPESRENKDFVQLYRMNMNVITKMGKDNPHALAVFMFLMQHMDNMNALIVSMKSMQEILGFGRTTLSTSVKYLKENGYICVMKSGTSNVYIMNPDIAWNSYANQKKYCKFQSNVLLSASENAEYLNNSKAFDKFKAVNESFMNNITEKREEYEQRISEIHFENNMGIDPNTGEVLDEEKALAYLEA